MKANMIIAIAIAGFFFFFFGGIFLSMSYWAYKDRRDKNERNKESVYGSTSRTKGTGG